MFIYKITNKINNKIYIGKTREDNIRKRWDSHLRCYKRWLEGNFRSCSALYSAFTKYGIENFMIEELDRSTFIEELNFLERYYIQHLNARNKDIGYNLQYGGDGGWEYVNELYESGELKHASGWTISDEGRKNISDGHKGITSTWKGKHLTENHKKSLSNSMKIARATYAPIWNKGIPQSEDHNTNRAASYIRNNHRRNVLCIETGVIYSGIKEASRAVGLASGVHISDCCNGHRETTKGYHWKYV